MSGLCRNLRYFYVFKPIFISLGTINVFEVPLRLSSEVYCFQAWFFEQLRLSWKVRVIIKFNQHPALFFAKLSILHLFLQLQSNRSRHWNTWHSRKSATDRGCGVGTIVTLKVDYCTHSHAPGLLRVVYVFRIRWNINLLWPWDHNSRWLKIWILGTVRQVYCGGRQGHWITNF